MSSKPQPSMSNQNVKLTQILNFISSLTYCFIQENHLNIMVVIYSIATVQTFNSCASQHYVCQCLVVQTPTDIMSNKTPSTSITCV